MQAKLWIPLGSPIAPLGFPQAPLGSHGLPLGFKGEPIAPLGFLLVPWLPQGSPWTFLRILLGSCLTSPLLPKALPWLPFPLAPTCFLLAPPWLPSIHLGFMCTPPGFILAPLGSSNLCWAPPISTGNPSVK